MSEWPGIICVDFTHFHITASSQDRMIVLSSILKISKALVMFQSMHGGLEQLRIATKVLDSRQLAHLHEPLTRLLVPLTFLLRSPALLRSLVRSLAHSLTPELMG